MLPLVFLATVLLGCDALTVQPLGFLKLNDSQPERPVFGNGAATTSAYDPRTGFLYVIGSIGDVLNIVDVNDPSRPRLIRKVNFEFQREGLPDAIAICNKYLAISFESMGTDSTAFLKIYKPLESPVAELEVLYDHVNLDGYDPTAMAWSTDCQALVVVQQGRIHKINNVFDDPKPYIEVVVLGPGGGTSRLQVPIRESALTEAKLRHVFTACDSSPQPASSAVQDLEPRSIVVDSNNVAFITFPKNNAIAGMSLNPGPDQYQLQFMNVGIKNWTSILIDGSANGMIDPENYPIHTFYQPIGISAFTHKQQTYIATSDMGEYMSMGGPDDGCHFEESLTGQQWINSNSFAPNVKPEEKEALRTAMNDPNKLGQMRFSNLKRPTDFYHPNYEGYSKVTGYGGRGMSVLNPVTRDRVFDSGDLFESVFTDPSFSTNYKSVYNADLWTASSSPSDRKDKASLTTGPTPRAIVSGEIGDTQVLVVANGHVGGFYYFTVDKTAAMPMPVYKGYYRRGRTGLSWLDSYARDDDSVGEPETKHIEWINRNSNTEAVIAVLGNRAGVLSLYRLTI